ncbi:polyprenyl synthetase family protein [Microbacterium koreense]|uniref:Polyprenyl synthetase family protein n=1 Tax=Microbacterium koreense TaxID=323761 RepID=A0ABW2ZRC3_9MICO
MIDVRDRTRIDTAIAEALDRTRTQAARLGGGFEALGDAIARAATGGKRFRPALVTAAFEAFGGDIDDSPEVYHVATAFELLHTAFVVHDDVIDNDTERRGIPNIGGEFRERARRAGAGDSGAARLGDTAAILAGDLLLHESTRLVATADVDTATRRTLLDLLDDAVYVSAAGELADVENSVIPADTRADEALATAFNKTAVYSFRAPLAAGAVLAGAPADARRVLEAAAGDLGLAFQLVDDLIGAFGTAADAGRESGADLREAKQTPLVALARESTAWARVNDALLVAYTGPIAVRDAQRELEASGARERLRDLIDDTLARVRRTADDAALPAEATLLLDRLADRIAGRVP